MQNSVVNDKKQCIPFCLLSGFLGCKEDWDPICLSLPHSYAFDLQDLTYHLPSLDNEEERFYLYALALKIRFDALELTRIHLVGYSMGGRLAGYFSALFPEKIASLTLISAHLGLQNSQQKGERMQKESFWINEIDKCQKGSLEPFLKKWYDQPLFATLKEKKQLFQKIYSHRVLQHPLQAKQLLIDLSLSKQPYLLPMLKSSPFPITLVYGEKDSIYSALYRETALQHNSWYLYEIKEAGHACHLEKPAVLTDVLSHYNSYKSVNCKCPVSLK